VNVGRSGSGRRQRSNAAVFRMTSLPIQLPNFQIQSQYAEKSVLKHASSLQSR
jgi:hypothetical protein